MNTAFAIAEFMKFVTKLNQYVAVDKLTRDMADSALPTFNKIMDVLGLKIVEASDRERKEIEEVVLQRNKLRAEKKFEEADDIRKNLLERSVDLLDHKGRTVWVKREKVEIGESVIAVLKREEEDKQTKDKDKENREKK
jgi:cysteinyl-tRNA synthetase